MADTGKLLFDYEKIQITFLKFITLRFDFLLIWTSSVNTESISSDTQALSIL
jgi:hypothetical protein